MTPRLKTDSILGIPYTAQWLVNNQTRSTEEPSPDTSSVKKISPKKWFPSRIRDDFLRLEKGDTVFVSKAVERSSIPGAGTLFWVLSPENKVLYCVAESFGGPNLNQLLTYTRDSEGNYAYNAAQSRKLTQRFESLFVNRSGTVPMNKVPVQTKVNSD